jgi:hypothetical protein
VPERARQALCQAVNHDDAGQAGEDLLLDQAVHVCVVPVGSGRKIARNAHADGAVAAGRHRAQDVVGNADRRDVEAMLVQICWLTEAVEEPDLDRVPRPDTQGRADEVALV